MTPKRRRPRLWSAAMSLRSLLKKGLRRLRDLRTRASLRRLAGQGALVLAPTWRFPNPTHTFVHEDMLGLAALASRLGAATVVLCGEVASAEGLSKRYRPLVRRARIVETVRAGNRRDLAGLDHELPGRVDAFLQRVAAATGRRLAELREDELVLRAATFTRLCQLAKVRYLHSWFCYDQSFQAMFAAQVLGVPRGLACFTDHVLADHPLKLVPLQLATADLVLATSARTRHELLQLGGDGLDEKLLVKPIGVDGEPLRAVRAARAAGPFTLVSICRIEPKKGLGTLVEAVARLRALGHDVRARLHGGIDEGHAESRAEAARLRAQIAGLGLGEACLLAGALANAAVPAALAAAHTFVAPYVELASGDKDGVPTALLEAMAAGRAIVASRAGAIPEAITDGVDGLLLPPSDVAALVQAVLRLLGEPALGPRLGAAAAARFDASFDVRVTERACHERVEALLSRSTR